MPSTLKNATVAAAANPLVYPAGVFSFGGDFDATGEGLVVQGAGREQTTLQRADGWAAPFLTTNAEQPAADYLFEDLTFDGNASGPNAETVGNSFLMYNAAGVTFRRCGFRNLIGIGTSPIYINSCRNILFEDCRFYGTQPGVMQAGVQYPPANSAAVYGQAVGVAGGNKNICFSRCQFHFCLNGLYASAGESTPTDGLTIENCTFRGDWWNGPYKIQRLQATAYNNSNWLVTASTPYARTVRDGMVTAESPLLNSATANFTPADVGSLVTDTDNVIPPNTTITAINSGTEAVMSAYATSNETSDTVNIINLLLPYPIAFRFDLPWTPGSVTIDSTANIVTLPVLTGNTYLPGDEITTTTGLRAEITGVISGTLPPQVSTTPWESIDTYEPSATPDSITSSAQLRVSRYFASLINNSTLTSTSFNLYYEPFNPFTGQKAVTDAKLDLTTLPASVTASFGYSGINVGSGQNNLLIQGNRLRGSHGDQISVWNTIAPRIIGNSVSLTEDVGVTLENCQGAVVQGNTFSAIGTNAVGVQRDSEADILTDSNAIIGNTYNGWGYSFEGGNFSAVSLQGTNHAVSGNAFIANSQYNSMTTNYGVCLEALNESISGCSIGPNIGNGLTADVSVVIVSDNSVTNIKTFGVASVVYQGGATFLNTQILTISSSTATPDFRLGEFCQLIVTNGNPLIVANPIPQPPSQVQPLPNQQLTIEIYNNSDASLGTISWGSLYLFPNGALVNPSNGKYRQITFRWNGAYWIGGYPSNSDYLPNND